jgi:hypothetical protein
MEPYNYFVNKYDGKWDTKQNTHMHFIFHYNLYTHKRKDKCPSETESKKISFTWKLKREWATGGGRPFVWTQGGAPLLTSTTPIATSHRLRDQHNTQYSLIGIERDIVAYTTTENSKPTIHLHGLKQ